MKIIYLEYNDFNKMLSDIVVDKNIAKSAVHFDHALQVLYFIEYM